ncbi:polysaccharide lyase family 8 super-sandwich domain-containing protein, partial [Dyadobacter sp.]|uniref:polysaccharide lyase family 8 super-sandwich domain-containing protein n=1 Tax=Dyadobacter sp. TaxID=1914288 RepID=UPI003F707AA5
MAENLLRATSYRKAKLENIVRIRKGEVKPNLTRDHYFWHSHYYTHQRPDYYASVRMHSKRAANMEQPHNEEGLKNHHYGDGSNFISQTGKEFDGIFPVWDWQKIPGTTVVQKPEVAHWKELAKPGLNDFTGGVTDQRYGAAAFDFASVHDPLKARKAWFFFDREFVSLGS